MDRALSEVKIVENFLKPTNDNKPQIKKKNLCESQIQPKIRYLKCLL